MVSGFRILVAESSPVRRGHIAFPLRTVGFRVVEADNGDDALEKTLTSLFNLIIVGLDLPKLNGLDLIQRLQSRQGLCRIPVLVVPGRSDQQLVRSLKACVQGWIEEPIGPEHVINVVRRNLD